MARFRDTLCASMKISRSCYIRMRARKNLGTDIYIAHARTAFSSKILDLFGITCLRIYMHERERIYLRQSFDVHPRELMLGVGQSFEIRTIAS